MAAETSECQANCRQRTVWTRWVADSHASSRGYELQSRAGQDVFLERGAREGYMQAVRAEAGDVVVLGSCQEGLELKPRVAGFGEGEGIGGIKVFEGLLGNLAVDGEETGSGAAAGKGVGAGGFEVLG